MQGKHAVLDGKAVYLDDRGRSDFKALLFRQGRPFFKLPLVERKRRLRALVSARRPVEPQLRKVLPWLAAERPDVFNAYQQTQGEKLENAMKSGATHVASFIGHAPGKALFVGVYEIEGSRPLTREEYWETPAEGVLKTYGARGFQETEPRHTVLWFDLALTNFYAHWKGKLVVGWPPHKNEIPPPPFWKRARSTRRCPGGMSSGWGGRNSRCYRRAGERPSPIGAASTTSSTRPTAGATSGQHTGYNILQRWLQYAATGHGGNVLLRKRDPRHFQFSILQRVSPDMEAAEVIAVEATWKERLHTREPFGLNENCLGGHPKPAINRHLKTGN